MTDPALTIPLETIGRGDLAIAGGKGANLGELIRNGFPVPPGFVITTAAYNRVVTANGIGQTIHAAIGNGADGESIRRAIEEAPIPAEVEQAIRGAYRQLGGAVAVRSSATAEDLPGMAFAGQQETYLNMVGEAAVLDATRRCWASLWTDRAIAYRDRNGIDQAGVTMAVVVQRLVPAEAAGVLFTANPVSGDRSELVINASPGLGEAVVSGQVTPDHLVVDAVSLAIKERTLGRREIVIRARAGGGTEETEGDEQAGTAAIPDATVRQLSRLGIAIQRHFGSPQDIEWTIANGDLFIVQARPMTALPEPAPPPNRFLRQLAPILAEIFAIRPYPLDLTTWITVVSSGILDPMFRLLGIIIPPVETLFSTDDGVLDRFRGQFRPKVSPAIVIAPLRLVGAAMRPPRDEARPDPDLAAARRRVAELEALDLDRLPWETLLDRVRETMGLAYPLGGLQRRRYFPRAMVATGLLALFLLLARRVDRLLALLSGAESETVAANRAIERLAGQVRADPALAELFAQHEANELPDVLVASPSGQQFLGDLSDFLQRYGHREVVLSSVWQPTWKQAPELVLGIIKTFAQSEARLTAGPAAWETARADVLAQPLLRIPPVRGLFLRLLGTARTLFQIRENTHYDVVRLLPVLRRLFLEFGSRLAAVGILDQPDEVFHLTFDDLVRLGQPWPPDATTVTATRALVRRRASRRAALDGTPIFDLRHYLPATPAGDALLSGTPGSPGLADGTVRVIRTSAEFDQLMAGEILVAPFTNPAWTPLFLRAAAVVVDSGSAGSHAAIVAREYGLPAVMGTVDGTSRLRDGDRVRVDGHRGLVFRKT